MYKKRWYDGLHDIYEGKDEFEIKFGCLIGDGGGNNGGGDDKKRIQEEQNKRAEDQEPVRGGNLKSSGLFTQQVSLTSPTSLSGRGYAPNINAGQSYANSLFDSGVTNVQDVRDQATNISTKNLTDYLSGGMSTGGYNTPSTGLSLDQPLPNFFAKYLTG